MVEKQIFSAATAAPAIGPYSPMVGFGNISFLSGQLGLTSEGKLLEGIEAQTHQVLKNIAALLKEANMTMENVLQATVYIANMNDFAKINEIYGQYIPKPYPARAVVQVARLPKDALIEIAVIAGK
jgi:2-iminobutanoate/2-iminopropanoate deaminase